MRKKKNDMGKLENPKRGVLVMWKKDEVKVEEVEVDEEEGRWVRVRIKGVNFWGLCPGCKEGEMDMVGLVG